MRVDNHKYALALIETLLCGWLISCSGGGTTNPPNGGDDNQLANLTGSILVEDTPLADISDITEIGVQDADKWILRVIDPTESLDDITIPHTDTNIIETELAVIPDALLSVYLQPALDLTGGSAEITPVVIDLMLPLEESITTSINANISFEEPLILANTRGVSQAIGYIVRIEYTAQHGTITQNNLIELDWNQRRLRRDTNGNGMLDDEMFFADLDLNGISSNYQRGLDDRRGQGSTFSETGNVSSVFLESGAFNINQRTYLVDETTVITDISNTTITLEDISVGNRLRVTGSHGQSGARYSDTVEILY